MLLDKDKMIGEVGRRTRLRNHNVQNRLGALIEIWSDKLASGGHIAMENFLVLEVKSVDRGVRAGSLLIGGKLRRAPRVIRKLVATPSKALKQRLRN